jgi:hypothetical protein
MVQFSGTQFKNCCQQSSPVIKYRMRRRLLIFRKVGNQTAKVISRMFDTGSYPSKHFLTYLYYNPNQPDQ